MSVIWCVEHKHLLIQSTFTKSPFTSEQFTNNWIKKLVKLIDMELLYAPKSVRCNNADNEGVSSFCLITTSHICLHSWDMKSPNLVQLDIYSCKDFELQIVLDEINKFNPIELNYKFLDRNNF